MGEMGLKKAVLCSILFMFIMGSLIPGVGAAANSVYPSDNGPRQSSYAAPLAKPELKWAVPFTGEIKQVVIDSAGILYVLSEGVRVVKLTSLRASGEILWSKEIKGVEANALNLSNDKFLIVSSSLDGRELTDSSRLNDRTAIVSKYTIAGELLWENTYEYVMRLGNITVGDDGYVALALSYFTQASGSKRYTEHVKLIGMNASGETKFNNTMVSDTETVPVYFSAPLIVKDNVYLSISKGFMRPYSSRAMIAEFTDAQFLKISKQGVLLSSTKYKGIIPYAPVYYNNNFYVSGEPYGGDNNLYIINTAGKITKTISVEAGHIGNQIPASISTDGHIVFAQHVYSPAGKLLWSFQPTVKGKVYRFYPYSVPGLTLDSSQNIVFSGYDSLYGGAYISSINMKTKKINWSLPINTDARSPIIIGKDGTIYVWGNKLYAYGKKAS